MLNEAPHACPSNTTSTEDLDSVTCCVLCRLSRIHLEQGDWASKVLGLLLVRLHHLEYKNKTSGKWAYHVVHLVRDILQPALHRLGAGNHGSNFAADDGLRCQGLPKCLALTYPLEALLHDRTLSTSRGSGHHPAFVIKIAAIREPSGNIAHVTTTKKRT